MKTTYQKYFIVSILALVIAGCSRVPEIGIIKDLNGITTTYSNIKPEEVYKKMNGENFNHNQIPLGESFEVINNSIHGLTEKDGNVSIGCSLKIKDKKGNVLLNEEDLFKENAVYAKDSLNLLRCTVSTGSPMQYDEKYDVEIKYWDKFGDGTLENKMEIEMIDLP
ncbi:MAG: hypothetical protein ABI772_01705 [Bacteroidota bacterium]